MHDLESITDHLVEMHGYEENDDWDAGMLKGDYDELLITHEHDHDDCPMIDQHIPHHHDSLNSEPVRLYPVTVDVEPDDFQLGSKILGKHLRNGIIVAFGYYTDEIMNVFTLLDPAHRVQYEDTNSTTNYEMFQYVLESKAIINIASFPNLTQAVQTWESEYGMEF